MNASDHQDDAGPHGSPASVHRHAAHAVFAALFLAVTIATGVRHDYASHAIIWRTVLAGGDPWFLMEGMGVPLHSYGPLFNSLAWLYAAHELAPKLLFAGAYVAFIVWLAAAADASTATTAGCRRSMLGLPTVVWIGGILNPLPWVEVAYFGHFDVLVGVTCVAAIHAWMRGRAATSGVWLGLGILTKYLPLVLVPCLLADRRPLRGRLLFACAATVSLGFAASTAIWGTQTFRAVTHAATRRAELLSVFRFLEGEYSPVRSMLSHDALNSIAMVIRLGAVVAVLTWCWWRAIPAHAAAVLAMLTTLLFYQVGFVQYQLVLLMIVLYWCTTGAAGDPADHPALRITLFAYFGWLAAFDLFYAQIGGYLTPTGGWAWIEEVVGLPTFILGGALLVTLIGALRRSPPAAKGGDG